MALAYFRYELKFTGSTSSVGSNFVGTSADGKSKHTDGQVRGSPSWLQRLPVAFDVSIVNPTAVSHSGAGACSESFLKPNACRDQDCRGDETNKDKLLCQQSQWQRGMDFVPIVFTTSGGMGEQFQRRYWNPHWTRVASGPGGR